MASWTPHDAGQQLMAVFPLIARVMKQRMREMENDDITMMQVSVLRQLQEQPTTASELAKVRHTSLQAVSVLIQGMVERGWILRRQNASDRRQHRLEVTSEGLAVCEVAQEQMVAMAADLFDQLTPEEIEAAEIVIPALRRVLASQLSPEASLVK